MSEIHHTDANKQAGTINYNRAVTSSAPIDNQDYQMSQAVQMQQGQQQIKKGLRKNAQTFEQQQAQQAFQAQLLIQQQMNVQQPIAYPQYEQQQYVPQQGYQQQLMQPIQQQQQQIYTRVPQQQQWSQQPQQYQTQSQYPESYYQTQGYMPPPTSNQVINQVIQPPQQVSDKPAEKKKLNLKASKFSSQAPVLNAEANANVNANVNANANVITDLALKVVEEEKRKQEEELVKEMEKEKEKELQREKESLQKKEAEELENKRKAEEAVKQSRSFQKQTRTMEQIKEILAKIDLQNCELIQQNIRKLQDRQLKELKGSSNQGGAARTHQNKSNYNPSGQGQRYSSSYVNPNKKNQLMQGSQQSTQQQASQGQNQSDLKRGDKGQAGGYNQNQNQGNQNNQSTYIRRVFENDEIREKKKKMLGNDWLGSVKQQDEDELIKIKKNIKFKLNQLAPDNKEQIIPVLISILVQYKDQYSNLACFCAGLIMEKAWLEPRYRELYTEVCKRITTEAQLTQIVEEVGKPKKERQIFKDAIINQVQEAFESEELLKTTKQADEMTKEEIELTYIRRKNRIMGNVRFIGELFIVGVIPEIAIYIGVGALVTKYILSQGQTKNVNQKNKYPEDHIEGVIELFDRIGKELELKQNKKKKQVGYHDLAQLENMIKSKNHEQVAASIHENNGIKLKLNQYFDLFNILHANFKFSKRIQLLIQNLEERRNKNWALLLNQKNESAKTKSQLERDLEEGDQQSNQQQRPQQRQSQSNQSYQPKQSQSQQLYQPKEQKQQSHYNQPSQHQQQQSQSSLPTEKVLEDQVNETFTYRSMDEQLENLIDIMKEIKDDRFLNNVFWKAFFVKLLEPKQSSIERSQIVFEIVNKTQSPESITYGFNEILSEDYIYNTIDADLGRKLYAAVILQFLGNESEHMLKYFTYPPGINDDWLSYLSGVKEIIVQEDETLTDKIELFLRNNLKITQF